MKLNVRKQTNIFLILINIGLVYLFANVAFVILFRVYLKMDIDITVMNTYVVPFLALYGLYKISRMVIVWSYLRKRKRIIDDYAQETGITSLSIAFSNVAESIKNIVNDPFKYYRNPSLKNTYGTEDWWYGELEFSEYRRSKYGKYDVAKFYFSITAIKLPRKLPNVFFDSKKTGGREFKRQFNPIQHHSLESTFNNYFDTYFHEDYTIDSLSFITPEVMEALVDADEYDVEIYEDYVYLYNELESMPNQIADATTKAMAIKTKLLNNIVTYRDDRIPMSDGRRTVSILGLNLKKSKRHYYTMIVITILVSSLSLLIYLTGYKDEVSGGYAPVTYIAVMAITYIVKSILEIRKINKEERATQSNTHVAVK